MRVLQPYESESTLIHWLQSRLSPYRTLIGYHPVEVWTLLMKVAGSVSSADPRFYDTLAELTRDALQLARDGDKAATSLAETCALAGISTWHRGEAELRAGSRKGPTLELTTKLLSDVVASWRLWARRERPNDEVPQQFARTAEAAWRIGDERVHAYSYGHGVHAGPEVPSSCKPNSPPMPASVPARSRIPTTVYIRPCLHIAEEATPAVDGLNLPIAERYKALTEELPLAGAAVMRTNPAGVIALVARLRAAAPWLEPAIEKIEEQLRIQNWAGRPWLSWRPLCLTGAPGAGKSYFARLVGELAGSGHATLDLGGVSDNRTLEGTARGWTNAQPCWPSVVMSQTRTANPVLLLEEIEKACGSARNGVPHATLLTMIEAETANSYWDKCLLGDVDLSHCCWIMTANSAAGLPGPLRSRIDTIEVDGPGPEHFDHIITAVAGDWRAAGMFNQAKSQIYQIAPTERSGERSTSTGRSGGFAAT